MRAAMRPSIIVWVIILFIASGSYAQGFRLEGPLSEVCEEDGEDLDEARGIVSATGEALEYYSPDAAIVTLAVESIAVTAVQAASENATRVDGVMGALKELVAPGDGEYIKTTSYSLQPLHEYDQTLRKSSLTGYRATHEIKAKTRRTELAGKIIDTALQSGANRVQGVSFELFDTERRCEEVLAQAALKAKRQASFMAKTLGSELSDIKIISPRCGPVGPGPVFRQALMETRTETAIETGDIAVSASVSVVYYLKPPGK